MSMIQRTDQVVAPVFVLHSVHTSALQTPAASSNASQPRPFRQTAVLPLLRSPDTSNLLIRVDAQALERRFTGAAITGFGKLA
jgi:hypothetical protein